MESNFQEILNNVSEHVKGFAKTDTVVGEEFTLGNFKCKPVIKVGVGFGGGTGTGDHPKKENCNGSGTGAGAGVGVSPVGFLIAKGDEISFVPADQKKGLAAIFEKVPDLMEKAMEMKKQKEEKAEK